jgi:hypothetical protein
MRKICAAVSVECPVGFAMQRTTYDVLYGQLWDGVVDLDESLG